MKFQVIICLSLFLLETALCSPFEDYDGMIQQDIEAEDYDGMVQQDIEAEDYDGMIQQDIQSKDYDGMIQQMPIDMPSEAETQVNQKLIGRLAPLYRYWRYAGSGSDHFYTTNPFEIGAIVPGLVGKYGYKFEGVPCFIYSSQVAGSVPLYRYFRGGSNDHFYTTNAKEIGTTTPGKIGRHGYKSEGRAGYCFPTQRPGTIPLFRYWHPGIQDHFYTTNIREIGTAKPGQRGRHGYIAEGVACFVIANYV